MSSVNLIFFSFLGVAFCEAVRVYRCVLANKRMIPEIGFSKRVNFFIYASVLTIFIFVACFFSIKLNFDSEIKAFLFGVAVPTGSRLITPSNGFEGEVIEDLESELNNVSFLMRCKIWLYRFNI